jgi:hypothetical protein
MEEHRGKNTKCTLPELRDKYIKVDGFSGYYYFPFRWFFVVPQAREKIY